MAISRKTAEPPLQSLLSLTLPCCLHGAHYTARVEEEIHLWQHTAQPLFCGKNVHFSVLKRKRGLLGLHGNLDLFHPSLSSLVPPVWYTAVCYDGLKLSLISWFWRKLGGWITFGTRLSQEWKIHCFSNVSPINISSSSIYLTHFLTP